MHLEYKIKQLKRLLNYAYIYFTMPRLTLYTQHPESQRKT